MQVITEYSDEQLDLVLEATEKLEAHLTAAVVSNDAQFTQKVGAKHGLLSDAVLVRCCLDWTIACIVSNACPGRGQGEPNR